MEFPPDLEHCFGIKISIFTKGNILTSSLLPNDVRVATHLTTTPGMGGGGGASQFTLSFQIAEALYVGTPAGLENPVKKIKWPTGRFHTTQVINGHSITIQMDTAYGYPPLVMFSDPVCGRLHYSAVLNEGLNCF